jgi:transcription elongation factor Elf1
LNDGWRCQQLQILKHGLHMSSHEFDRMASIWISAQAQTTPWKECMSLVLHCPHCRHLQEDPFEVLVPNDEIDWMKCEACEKPFFFAILECPRCAGESAYSWLLEPPPQTLAMLTCRTCHSTYSCHENSRIAEASSA